MQKELEELGVALDRLVQIGYERDWGGDADSAIRMAVRAFQDLEDRLESEHLATCRRMLRELQEARA